MVCGGTNKFTNLPTTLNTYVFTSISLPLFFFFLNPFSIFLLQFGSRRYWKRLQLRLIRRRASKHPSLLGEEWLKPQGRTRSEQREASRAFVWFALAFCASFVELWAHSTCELCCDGAGNQREWDWCRRRCWCCPWRWQLPAASQTRHTQQL